MGHVPGKHTGGPDVTAATRVMVPLRNCLQIHRSKVIRFLCHSQAPLTKISGEKTKRKGEPCKGILLPSFFISNFLPYSEDLLPFFLFFNSFNRKRGSEVECREEKDEEAR